MIQRAPEKYLNFSHRALNQSKYVLRGSMKIRSKQAREVDSEKLQATKSALYVFEYPYHNFKASFLELNLYLRFTNSRRSNNTFAL